MSNILTILLLFLKIGLFSFGGGYAIMPVIKEELEKLGWMGAAEFADIVAVSQMTPGPIAVNAATYVGFRIEGFLGSFAATFAVAFPSFIIVVLVASFMKKFSQNKYVNAALSGIRPSTIGLIMSAVIIFSYYSIINLDAGSFSEFFNLSGVIIFALIFYLSYFKKLNPIYSIIISAVLGIFMM